MQQAQTFYIRPTDPARLAAWLDLLNRDTLPVRDFRPRPGETGAPVYDVATDRLSGQERARLAGFIARQNGGGYLDALQLVDMGGVAVPAVGCELVMTKEILGDATT